MYKPDWRSIKHAPNSAPTGTLFKRINSNVCLRLALTLSALVVAATGQALDPFGNGTIKTPTSASGGTGTVANLQTDNDVNYTVVRGATANIGGFGTHGGAITSVYLFVQYTVETGYTGTNAVQVNGVNTTIVPAQRDYGRWAYVDITAGAFGVNTSDKISALSVSFNNNDDSPSNAVLFDCVYVVVNPQTAIPVPPTWSEDFNGTGQANPMVWNYEVGYQRNSEAQYYMSGTSNGWQEGGNFVIEGRKESVGGYQYTSASIVTSNKYYWKYGRAQIRAKIPAKPGMWPAIWGCGEVGSWPHNGEVDIMEYYGEKILANCAVGTTTQWGSKWDSETRSLPSLLAVDSNWRNEWHIWTMQWDDLNVRLYVDNILLNTIPQTWLKNTDGYNTAWGPQYPFISNGMSCWLNLAMGGPNGGDPTVTMDSGPQRYLIDYWKIWEGATNNVAPTNIALSGNGVTEGQAIGTIVGNLSATDADPAEVHRYTLVTGTGSTHNSQFTIPEFLSDSTTQGVIKTAAVLNYDDGPTRSIRVRVTDIEGATYDKVLTINVLALPKIEVNPSSVTVAEGGTQTFQVRLRSLPASNITVNVVRQSGDSNITVSSGSSLLFTPTNGTSWQTVTLAAAEDVDKTNGVATILCSDPSSTYTSVSVTATESDNDNSAPLVNAGVDSTVILSGSTPWTPAEMSLTAWYDAADATTLTAPGGVVSRWNNKSSSNFLAQDVVDKQPTTGTRTINNVAAVDFDGINDLVFDATTMPDGDTTLFAVALPDTVGNVQILSNAGSSGSKSRQYLRPNGVDFGNAALLYSPAPSNGIPVMLMGRVEDLGDASVQGYRINAGTETTGTVARGVPGSSTTLGAFKNGTNENAFYDGLIGEIIVINSILSDADRQKLEGYLAHKWALTDNLPLNHPYIASAPARASTIANLDGTVSDAENDPLTSTWTRISGPAAVTFGNANAVDTTVSFTVAGTYVLRLTTTDGNRTSYDEVTFTVSNSSPTQIIDTWIIAGQSNAEGYGITQNPVSGLTPATTLSSIGRSNLNVTHSNIQMYQGANNYNNIATSAGLSLPAKNSWHSMTAQEGLTYDWGTGRGNESGRRFGPELAFGYDMQRHLGKPIALIKYAQGSIGIASSTTQESGVWKDFDPSDGGRLNHYDKIVSTIQNAVNSLPAGQVLNVRGVLWMQGESDANATSASSYQANLTEFISTLRTNIGTIAAASSGKMTRSAASWNELDVFVGTVLNLNTHYQTVINAQNAVAAADANVYTVNATTGLSLMTSDDWLISGLHYDTAGQVLLGERFASAAIFRASYDDWTGGTFANPLSNSAPNADPDGDGLVTLLEFAFNTDPTSGTSGPIQFIEGGEMIAPGVPDIMNYAAPGQPAEYRAVFARRKDYAALGLTYSVWFSADLVNWTQSVVTPTLRTSPTDPGDYEAVSVPYPTSLPTPKFFKVGVTSN